MFRHLWIAWCALWLGWDVAWGSIDIAQGDPLGATISLGCAALMVAMFVYFKDMRTR